MNTRRDHLDTLAIGLLLACCLFWGFQQVLVKATLPEVPPLMQAAVRFAGIALEGAERMLELQLKTAKIAFADGVQQAKAIAEIKDVQEIAQFRNTLAQPTLEKATSYVKSVYDVATATQGEMNKLIEEQVAEFNKQMVTGLDKAVKSAPAGSEVAMAAVKSAITAVNSVPHSFEQKIVQ